MENTSVVHEFNSTGLLDNSSATDEPDTSSACCGDSTESYVNFGRNTWTYGSPFLVILGTIGNVLSAIVMQSKRLRKYTTSVYLTMLACVDTAVLYTGLSRQWVLAVFNTDLRFLTSGLCKLHLFLMYFLVQLEAWILVCVSIERLVAVWLPLKAQRIFTRRFARIQMTGILFGLFILSSHLFRTQILVPIGAGRGSICRFDPFFEFFRLKIWGWIDMVFASILPFGIMISSSIAIVVKLYIQHRKTASQGNTAGKNASVTMMLLAVCGVFFVCTLPITIYLSKSSDYEQMYGCCYSNNVTWPLVNMFMYLNHAGNFFLYCTSGPRFRAELLQIFKRKRIGVSPEDANHTEESTM